MPIPTPAFEMTYEEYRERYLRQNPWATEARCQMEYNNAKAGPETAAILNRAIERQLLGCDLKANLKEARKLIDAALASLPDDKSDQ